MTIRMNSIKRLWLVPVVVMFSLSFASAQQVKTGEDVFRAMHDKYPDWYKTVTFTQKSTTYNADGTAKVETWYEALLAPGKLRIDIGPASDGKGYIFADGNVTIVKENKVASSTHNINMLLVLGFDVYRQSAADSAAVAKAEGFDLSKVHEDVWEGKPVYVVGADKGDLKSKQFWIEKKDMLFVRLLEPSKPDPAKMDDIRFVDYRPLPGGWIAARVEVHSEDKLVFSEDYTEIQANVKLDPGTFDAAKFSTTHWEKP
jgi:hypothetical protein